VDGVIEEMLESVEVYEMDLVHTGPLHPYM
jgi:hypothetical protein